MKPSNELIKAAETVFLAMAYTDSIRPIVEGYQLEIIKKHSFRIDKKWCEKYPTEYPTHELITDISDAYLLSSEDSEIYFNELDKAAKEHGFNVEPRYCPLLIAESLQRDAEREMLKAAQYITQIDPDTVYKLETLRKLKDLTLRLCAPFINSKQVLKSLNY